MERNFTLILPFSVLVVESWVESVEIWYGTGIERIYECEGGFIGVW